MALGLIFIIRSPYTPYSIHLRGTINPKPEKSIATKVCGIAEHIGVEIPRRGLRVIDAILSLV